MSFCAPEQMKHVLPIIGLLGVLTAEAASLECIKEDNNTILIKMELPHPKEALVQRPDGDTVFLQVEGSLAHKQIANFENLEEWTITLSTLGTVYRDGEAIAEPIISGSGRYHLYIADNVETERENTLFIECYFEITASIKTKDIQLN